jgi:hypothetical protein
MLRGGPNRCYKTASGLFDSPLSCGHLNLCNVLIYRAEFNCTEMKSLVARVDAGAGVVCVFFAQHLPEKRRKGLWEGAFFVACKTLSANVSTATEGGIPVSRYPAGRIAPSGKPGSKSKLG